MKYFNITGNDWHCDDIFNWVAIDCDGKVFLYEKKPFIREEKGYWTSGGHSGSYDKQLPIKVNATNWRNSLAKLT